VINFDEVDVDGLPGYGQIQSISGVPNKPNRLLLCINDSLFMLEGLKVTFLWKGETPLLSVRTIKDYTFVALQDLPPVILKGKTKRHTCGRCFGGTWSSGGKEDVNYDRNTWITDHNYYFIDMEDQLVKVSVKSPFRETVVKMPLGLKSKPVNFIVRGEELIGLTSIGEVINITLSTTVLSLTGSNHWCSLAPAVLSTIVSGWNTQTESYLYYLVSESLGLLSTLIVKSNRSSYKL